MPETTENIKAMGQTSKRNSQMSKTHRIQTSCEEWAAPNTLSAHSDQNPLSDPLQGCFVLLPVGSHTFGVHTARIRWKYANKAPFYGMWLGDVSDKRIAKQPQPRLTYIHFKAWKTRSKYPYELRTCPCNIWRNFNCCSWHLCLHYPWGNPWLHSFNTNPLCTDLLKPELWWWQEKSSTHGHKTLKTAQNKIHVVIQRNP